MKRKLKTWKAFEAEFEPLVNEWDHRIWNNLYITYNNMHWNITPEMKRIFGTEIEVRKINDKHYTYKGLSYAWHESWFEPEFKEIEFISEDEMTL